MNPTLIAIITIILVITLGLILYLLLLKKKKIEDPILKRIEGTVIILNQKIHAYLLKSDKLDKELNNLLFKKGSIEDKNIQNELDTIEKKIETTKKDINILITRIEEMKKYKEELENILKKKKVESKEISKLLDEITEKIRYYY